jgi:hypothetical protein
MRKLLCSIFGHTFRLHRHVTTGIREVGCVRCKQLFGMNDFAQAVLPLDQELRDLHDGFITRANEKKYRDQFNK